MIEGALSEISGVKGLEGNLPGNVHYGIQGPPGPKGDRGDPGPAGPRGPQGIQGKTPVKGEDYFTDSDKAQIAAMVEILSDDEIQTLNSMLKSVSSQEGGA